jgi:hypothetical protein
MEQISRGTKCLGAYKGVDCAGAYPSGYLAFLQKQGWWGEKRVHLCSGRVKDNGFKVDIRPEMEPDLVADARATGLPTSSFDCALIDPPYSEELAKRLYGTEKFYGRVDSFITEGVRLVRSGGLVVSLSYNIPKLAKGADLIAVWGIYEVPSVSSMRCLCVFKKKERLGDDPIPPAPKGAGILRCD